MRLSLGKSMIRIILLALFVTGIALFVTVGQASAHSSWDGGCDHDHGCHGYDYGSSHEYDVSDNCDQWDPHTGYCMHWKLDISSEPVYDRAYHSDGHDDYYYYDHNYHDADYYYRYYCDQYKCDCK